MYEDKCKVFSFWGGEKFEGFKKDVIFYNYSFIWIFLGLWSCKVNNLVERVIYMLEISFFIFEFLLFCFFY